MMKDDALNSHVYPLKAEMTALSLRVCSTDQDESKGIIVHKILSQSCFTEEDEPKRIIVNKNLSRNCSTEEGELCSTEEGKSECTITKQKDAKNEVTYDAPKYFNAYIVFECWRKIFDSVLDSYEEQEFWID